jgi:hypothetical protein
VAVLGVALTHVYGKATYYEMVEDGAPAARDLLSYLHGQLEPDLTPLAEAIRLTHVVLKPAAR